MTPMEFMARISALIPPPRRPAFRHHGAFAPASKWRKLVVPAANTPPLQTELQNRCREREGQRAPKDQRESNSAARSAPETTSTPTEHDIIERILTHLRLPLEPEILSDGYTVAYDITGQPPTWVNRIFRV